MNIARGIFDLHCDTITYSYRHKHVLAGNGVTQVDLTRPPEGMAWCQTFAVYITDTLRGQPAFDWYSVNRDFFREQMAANSHLAEQARTAADIERILGEGKIAGVLSVEGGAVLMGNPDMLEVLHEDGVRFMTLTWNSANELAGGAATDLGLTQVGKQALHRMETLGIVADVSHLCDRSFWDVARAAERPFIATHSNSRAVCGHRRNLTDEQFRTMVDIKGLVGLNFSVEFLSEAGELTQEDIVSHRRVMPDRVKPEDAVAHVLHMLDLGGEDVVAVGSDYDGTTVPYFLPDAARGFPMLEQLLLDAGLGRELTHKVLFKNALDFLRRYDEN